MVRFSLRAIFIAVFVVAGLCCLFFALPSLLAAGILFVLWLLAPAAMIAGIVYGRGYVRAFCIGCAASGGVVPMLYFYLLATVLGSGEFVILDDEYGGIKVLYAVLTAAVGLSGLVSMGVRWLSVRRVASKKSTETTPPSAYMALHGRFQSFQLDTLSETGSTVGHVHPSPTATQEG